MERSLLPSIDQLRFSDLSFRYDGHGLLFKDSTFSFPMNELVWIRSSSGSGRSTLLQIMAGLILPTSGSYWINSEDIMEMSFEDFLPYRLSIGYGFDFGGLINNRTLIDNITLPLLYHKMMEPQQAFAKAEQVLQFLGAYKYKDQRPSLVPGGVRKLTCLIRAMIMDPQLLLIDDPSVGVGEETTIKYFELIERSRKEGLIKHVFMNSFDEKLMSHLSPCEITLQDGGELTSSWFQNKVVGL